MTICAGNSPVPGDFPAQRPVTLSFDVFFDLRLNKRLSKHLWGWLFETLSRPLWRHYNDEMLAIYNLSSVGLLFKPFSQLFCMQCVLCVSAYPFFCWWLLDHLYCTILSSNRKYETLAIVHGRVMKQLNALCVFRYNHKRIYTFIFLFENCFLVIQFSTNFS